MFTSLLLAASLTPGQPPVPNYFPPTAMPAYQMPAGYQVPATQPPMTTPPPMGVPMATPMQPVPDGGKNGGKNGNGKNGDDKKDGDDKKEDEKKEDEKKGPTKYFLEKTLAQTRLGEIMENRGITIYGWTAMSYTPSTASKSNLPMQMNDLANQYLLNQNWVHIEKTLDTDKKEFQWGWAMDWIVPGSDYRTTLPRGIWNSQLTANNGLPNLYGFDPFQFYVQAFLPGLGEGTTVKMGRFATHCEYELVQQPDTPFVSRSYLFQYNPFTHTGVWATTQLDDTWSVGYGAATGSDTFIDPANRFTYLGQIKWAPKDGKTSVLFNYVVTNPKYDTAEAFAFYNVYNMQLTHKFTDKLTYVLDGAFSHIDNAPGIGSTNWYGAANYLIYQHTEKVASTLRAEVFNDTNGFRTGFEGLYTEVTYGVAFKPCDALILRPSVRYDYNGYSKPFEGQHDLWTLAMEAIIRW